MNVDEATQAAKEYNENFVRQHFPLPSVTYSQRVAITLLAEVERLRAEVEILAVEVTRLQAIEHEQIETQAELAAAKAASELPVQVIDCYSFGDDVEVVCKCGDDADRLSGWIRERMKENSI